MIILKLLTKIVNEETVILYRGSGMEIYIDYPKELLDYEHNECVIFNHTVYVLLQSAR